MTCFAVKVLKVQKLTLHSPKRLCCTPKLPFIVWECNVTPLTLGRGQVMKTQS